MGATANVVVRPAKTGKKQPGSKANEPTTDGKKPAKKATGPVRTEREPFRYQGTAKLTSSLVKEMGEQPRVIADAILSSKQALSNEQIATLVKGKIKSVQPLNRVVGFYLTRWKNQGLVTRAS